jgi:hypothetical protein
MFHELLSKLLIINKFLKLNACMLFDVLFKLSDEIVLSFTIQFLSRFMVLGMCLNILTSLSKLYCYNYHFFSARKILMLHIALT